MQFTEAIISSGIRLGVRSPFQILLFTFTDTLNIVTHRLTQLAGMEEFRCDMAINAVQADQTPSQMYENKYQLLTLSTTGKFAVNGEKPDNVTFLQKIQKSVSTISSPEHTIRSSCSEPDSTKLIRFDDSIPTFALGLRSPPPIFGSNFVGEASFYIPPPLESVSDKPIQQAVQVLSFFTDPDEKISAMKGGYPSACLYF